ncbi:MAG: flagellar biosynthesis protein FlhA [Spongiibacteraceae bacterium]|jgi:flagellar biosynthesis protein FlhA|nr:flagellar biosynthesis protein FlhA [Spongiibacteraceae bacterium]
MLKFPKINAYIGLPILLFAVMAMMVVPLPPWLIDSLFTFNIVLSVLVLLVALSVRKPLDFAVFPTVLLLATLMRLALNVASTRLVLLNGHTGGDAAGKVIQAFGEVVIGGNYVVGLIVFIILTIINFVVITKGGQRISEVAARFTLDALPGKQMAVDADLNAGIINHQQAHQRRREVAREAEFYGAMDGASKFVRGDAVAGLLVLFINLIGGLSIGVFQHDLAASDAVKVYALLTIGDGLVSQIPALLLATAAAIVVTRVSDEAEMPDQIHRQLLASPRVLWAASAVMVVLGLIPGMPLLPFLVFGGALAYAGWRQRHGVPEDEMPDLPPPPVVEDALGWQDLPHPDPISIEVGYRLVPLLDPDRGGELRQRIRGARKLLSEQMGFVLPEVRIRDNLQLDPMVYRIKVSGAVIEKGEVDSQRLLAISTGEVYGNLDGELTREPAYQMEAVLIEPELKARALNLGYTVVDPATVMATHVGKVMRDHLDELLGHEEVAQLNERLKAISAPLAEALAAQLSPVQLLRVYRQLLADQVGLADLRGIATALVDSAEFTKDPVLLAADVRCALKRKLIAQIVGERDVLAGMTIDDQLEQTLLKAFNQAQQGNKVALDSFPIEPNLLAKLQQNMPLAKERLQQAGHPAVLLVTPQLRPLLARYARAFARGLKVISYNEVPEDMQIDVVGTLG